MHIEGAAYASVIAQIVMAIIALVLLIKKTPISLKITFKVHPEIPRLLGMMGNLFVRTIALNTALYFATSYATGYGKEYIAAYTIGINIWLLGAFMVDGYSSAGNILSGKFLGAKDYNSLVALSNKLIKYGLSVGIIIGLVGAVFYNFIGQIFTKDLAVLEQFYTVFWIVLITQPISAITFIFDGMFKGMGEMKYLRNLLILSTGFIFIPTLLVCDYYDLKLTAIWIAFTFWMIARGLPLIIKFRKKFLPLIQNN
jgi:putative MATE family efflux protein